ncbi:MAG: hypothetical protein Q7U68_04845, partial [Candidatus Roizmanbacteria bacterium]|nr:hypothetical protein [Candidatus Roizmanbacteria bacterium]
TSGINGMLAVRVKAERLASEVKDKYKDLGQKDILNELKKLYSEAYDENNGWMDGIKFDLQAKDIFKISQKEYSEHSSGLAGARFINKAEESLGSKTDKVKSEAGDTLSLLTDKSVSVGVEVGRFAGEIIKAIVEQNNKEVKEARERIYKELEKAKWKAW